MQTLDVFLSRLVPTVQGCPDPLLRQALVDSVIEFCEESLLVQATVGPINIVADTGTYTLPMHSADVMVAATLKVWYGTKQLSPAPASQIDTILAYVNGVGTTSVQKGEPDSFYEYAPGQIGVYPVPQVSVASYLTARVATKPVRSATTVDDVLYQDWVEGIVAGARARILDTPNQVYSADSAMDRAKFALAKARAVKIRLRGRIGASISVNSSPAV